MRSQPYSNESPAKHLGERPSKDDIAKMEERSVWTV